MRIVCWQTILTKSHSLFLSKNEKDVAKFGLNIFIHFSIYSYIQIYMLQYNDGIQKEVMRLPFEQNGAQFEIISGEN